ncbi:hypothetical protein [Botrimarina mediterranea]|uniref:Uncharacterized protein n=1 Tax=Botrimarina mediterranea TaxID=2528022 RepID=A0A518K915_9BACT|nr:hypothetical protein [Botrimarina mediterranea]QDV74270.1 hypothetical protein Spa11_24700 [Botrimarina mediterranea]
MFRPAYTLLELMIALGSASVLMAGLSSALFIAAQGLNLDQGASASRGRADAVMGRVLADARTATRFRSVTPTAIELDVADRTGDSAADRLRYEWSGVVGDPLTRTLNGGAAVTLLHDVRALTFESTTRAVATQDVISTGLAMSPIMWSQGTPATATGVTTLALSTPPKVVPGDLMLAMVATTGEQTSVTAAGWTELCHADNTNNAKLRLSVWQKTAALAEPGVHSWYWPNAADAVGGIAVVSNHNPSVPIAPTGMATRANFTGTNATCPSASVVQNNSIAMRLGAFGGSVGVSDPSDYNRIWAQSVSGFLTAAWTYSSPISSTATGTASYQLSAPRDYATITIVITPRILVGP